ncbi:MAG: hypothetical protein V4658_04130 [Bacteroidota bacterium]
MPFYTRKGSAIIQVYYSTRQSIIMSEINMLHEHTSSTVYLQETCRK